MMKLTLKRGWRWLAWTLSMFALVTALAAVHWHGYKARVPLLMRISVRCDNAFVMRVLGENGAHIGDVPYSDVGQAQNLYCWIPAAVPSKVVRLVAIGAKKVWVDGAQYEGDGLAAARPTIVPGIAEAPSVCSLMGFWLFYFAAILMVAASLWSLHGFLSRGAQVAWRLGWGHVALGAVVCVRLFVCGSRGLVDFPFDPTHYLYLAHHVANGQWLGDYSPVVLVKSVLYPILLAGIMWLNLPYHYVSDCCFIAVCWCLARAVRPLLGVRPSRVFFAVIIFAPLQMAIQGVGVQEFVTMSMFLFFSAFVALWLRTDRPVRRLFGWYVALGVGFCLMEFMREEHEFFELILVGLLVLYIVKMCCSRCSGKVLKCALFLVVPLAVCFLYDFPTSAVTFQKYGFWGTCERRDHDYKTALGTLLGIGTRMDEHYDFRIPLSKTALKEIAKLSPTCCELATRLLDPQVAAIGNDEQRAEDVAACPELRENIKCGWVQWEFRNAASMSGHYANWFEAREWYRRVSRDLAKGIADGKIAGVGVRAASNPPVDASVLSMFAQKIPDVIGFMFLWRQPLVLNVDLADNWKPAAEVGISDSDRWNYRALMGADAWPTHPIRLQGWGADQNNRPFERGDFGSACRDLLQFARSDVNNGLGVPLAENGRPVLFGFSFVADAKDTVVIQKGGHEVFRSVAQDMGAGNAHFHVDRITDLGFSPDLRKRRWLSAVLRGMTLAMPLLLMAFAVAFLILFWVWVRRRDRDSLDSLGLPLTGGAIGFGYFLLIVLAHVFLQCQYGSLIIYLQMPVAMCWVCGWMAVLLAMKRLVGMRSRN